jgi:hypothetical protein
MGNPSGASGPRKVRYVDDFDRLYGTTQGLQRGSEAAQLRRVETGSGSAAAAAEVAASEMVAVAAARGGGGGGGGLENSDPLQRLKELRRRAHS